MLKKTLLPLVALMVAVAFPVIADDKETSRDDIISADVFRVIDRHVFYTSFDLVTVEVEDGEVTLRGYATHPYKKSSFEKSIEKKVEGVKSVDNQIVVLPPSSFDDQIRYSIAYRIYADGRLLRYNINTYRLPIHIIVKNGSVKLEGEVASMMDKKLIESHARGLNGVLTVTNNLRIAE